MKQYQGGNYSNIDDAIRNAENDFKGAESFEAERESPSSVIIPCAFENNTVMMI